MCGRYHLNSTPAEILEHYGLEACAMDAAPMPSGEVFPGTAPFVIAEREAGVAYAPMFWGFRPFQVKGKTKQPINAKVESIFTSRYWQSSIVSRRCLIPVNSWDEWCQPKGESKQRWRLRPKIESSLFSLGGLYVSYEGKSGERTTGFAIITQAANQAVAQIHHRQPLIVMPEDYSAWLDNDNGGDVARRVTRRQGRNYESRRVD